MKRLGAQSQCRWSTKSGIGLSAPLCFVMMLFLVWITPVFADERACELAVDSWESLSSSADAQKWHDVHEAVLESCEGPAKSGSVEAQFHMAEFIRSENESQAKNWAQSAASKNYMPAMFLLSEFESNETKKLELIRKAAEAGYPKAQFAVGELYFWGRGGLAEDEKLSIQWKTKAAEGGFRKAQLDLGRMYENTESATKDEAKAQYWFKRALDSNFDPLLAAKLDPTSFERPMQFFTFYPCEGSGCQLTILGIGKIEPDSAAKLATMDPPPGSALYLHSPGGNLLGGLSLGQEIRKRQLRTIIGAPSSSPSLSYEPYLVASYELGILVNKSVCASSCAYAFLGGVARTVVQPETLLLHQFSSKGGVNDESTTQEVVAVLNAYVDKMGVSRKALDPALLNRPEQLGFLAKQDLMEYKVMTPDLTESLDYYELAEISDWKLEFEGLAPGVVMTRPTNYNTGQVTVAFSKVLNSEKFVLSVRVLWTDAADQEFVKDWQAVMFDQTEPALKALVCLQPDYKADGKHIISCEVPLFTLKAGRATWQRISSREQLIQYELSTEQYEMILNKRPRYLELEDPLPNTLREMRFTHECILTEGFFKIAALIR